jgi:general nucleoside transport system permease protein
MSDIVALGLLAFVGQVVRITIPYALAALGGTLTERSGLIDLALEAKLVVGAFCAAAVAHATGSMPVGIVGAGLGGAAVAALQVLCAVRLRADQVVVGVALNLAAMGLTRYLLDLLYGSSANSPPVPGVGGALFTNPILWVTVIAAAAVPLLVTRTRLGVRLRAAGDRPEALAAAGVSIARVRLTAALIGGALAGVGGAQLSLAVDGFSADMSGGRGYIALAAVILGGWRPAWAALACLGFGVAEALVIQLQLRDLGVPRELAQMLPYALTLLALALWPSRTQPPAALGRPD